MRKRDVLKYGVVLMGVAVAFVLFVNLYMKISTSSEIIDRGYCFKVQDVDCVLVLGAGVWGDKPSPMLKDRLQMGINIYKNDLVASKIIMTGDHGSKEYDEVNVMKKFATDSGVPSEDVFMDHAGFSTYDSIYRAKEIFGAKRIIIVTQKYHLPRALYIAKKLGLDAYGVEADTRKYAGQIYRESREVLARTKDFVVCLFKPEPIYLGDIIPISGDGNITNDNNYIGDN